MPRTLSRVDSAYDTVTAIKQGNSALYPWEWLSGDRTPLDWAHTIVTYATILTVDVDIKHIASYRLTIVVNPRTAPSMTRLAEAMAELEHYRDIGEPMPSRQALLLATQHVLRLPH